MKRLLLSVALLCSALHAYAVDYFVNGSCAVSGNGTANTCASATGGTGAWRDLTSITAGGPGDVIHIRQGTYNATQDYWNFPLGRNGAPGNPLVVQNYAGENVTLEGAKDIHGSVWSAVGGGVYRCSGGQCTTNRGTLFPMAAWYKRAGQTTEEVLYLKMSGNCDSTLPAGFMRYGTAGPVCVHLSDGSSPASAQYLMINMYNSGMLLNVNNTHDVTFRKNPAGGSFKIQRFVQYGVVMQSGHNVNITLDGLDVGYVMDRCVNADYIAGNDGSTPAQPANYHFLNNNLHHCGQEAIHDSDDSGPNGRIDGNEIHHVQSQPWFERCDSISGGGGCNVDGFSDQCSAIRLTTGRNYSVRGNYFHDNCGGMNGRGYDIDLEEWFYDTVIENNLTYNTAAGVASNGHISVSMFFESIHAGPFQNITVRNNRFYSTDACFSINIGLSGPQSINYYNNTCVDFREFGFYPGGDNGVTSGTINLVNNIFSAVNTSPDTALYIDLQKGTGFQTPSHNNLYCPNCSQLVRWKGQNYSGTTLNQLGTANVYGNPGLNSSLKLSAASGPAYNAGIALSPAFPDFEGDARPTGGAWDIGADEFTGASTPSACTYTYSAWSACTNGTQTRNVLTATPSGCTGTPVLTQSCSSAPATPTGVNATDGTSASSVTVSWAASTGATGYTVYRSTASGTPGSAVANTAALSWVDTSVVAGTLYYYSVVATNTGGSSAPSTQNSGYAGTLAGGGSGGALTGSGASNFNAVDLTSVGTGDWAKWPNYIHKASGGSQIQTFTTIGASSVISYNDDQRPMSWTDGTPTAVGTSDRNGIFTAGVGSGFQLTAPADTTTRTLYVYVGGYVSGGKLVAHLSDGSAADFVDTSFSSSTGQYKVTYVLTYRASKAGQQLTVQWTQASGTGNVTLQAAALGGASTASLTGTAVAGFNAVNLTSVGTSDWAKWPNYIHKASGGSQLPTFVKLGAAASINYNDDQRPISWTDGTPTASGTNDTNGVFTAGIGNGFQVTAPAGTTTRTLVVYVGGYVSGGKLIAHLSDGSSPDYVDTSFSSGTGQYKVAYTLTYRAASAGAQLIVQWTQASGTGNVTLQAAALK